jgi:hypothetical protein
MLRGFPTGRLAIGTRGGLLLEQRAVARQPSWMTTELKNPTFHQITRCVEKAGEIDGHQGLRSEQKK